MKLAGHLVSAIAATATLLSAAMAKAQDAAQGLALAKQVCAVCHAVDRTQARSPNGAAPRFEDIANIPGMTATALIVALQTPHRSMPNLILQPDEMRDVAAYILSLK